MKSSDFIDLSNVELLNIDEPKKKKKIFEIKTIIIILIMILILLFGIGLFWFLSYAKEITKEEKLENKIVELGTDLDKNVNNYVKDEKCKLNLENVDKDKIGKYKYYVNCKKKNYYGYIEVKDTTKPIVTTKVVNITKNNEFEIEQFIMNAYDLTEVKYMYDDNFDINNYNKYNGLYLIPIHVIDSSKNKTNVIGILMVSNLTAERYISASKLESTTYNATLTITDKIGINNSNYYVNAIRIYNYIFNGNEEYNKVKQEYQNTNKINNIEGKAVFDDELNNIKIVKILNKQELDLLNGSFPYTYSEISSLYYNLGYGVIIEESK